MSQVTAARGLSDAPRSAELPEIADRIGANFARPAAKAVDRDARFPHETFEALRDARMLAVLVPTDLGGGGATLVDTALAVEALGQHCGSSALIYAMHHIQVACLVRHGNTPWLRDYLASVAEHELLLASATTELGTGGDTRSSVCAVEPTDSGIALEKQAPVISYGLQADAILATARRAPEVTANDQVMVLFPTTDCTLERISVWNTLGFRGTCSDGFALKATGSPAQILTDCFATISAHTMLPITHVLWASVWLGIARHAVTTARENLRAAARKTPGTPPPTGKAVAELVGALGQFAALVHGAARDYQEAMDDTAVLDSMPFAIRMNGLKTSASQLLVEIVGKALSTCGMAAYSEDSPQSLGLALRDAYGAPLMIHNDRIYGHTAQMLLVSKDA